jgi:hypothetical protein
MMPTESELKTDLEKLKLATQLIAVIAFGAGFILGGFIVRLTP